MSQLIMVAIAVVLALALAINYVVSRHNIRAAEADLQTEKDRRRAVQLQLAMVIQRTFVAEIYQALHPITLAAIPVRLTNLKEILLTDVELLARLKLLDHLRGVKEDQYVELVIYDTRAPHAPVVVVRVDISSHDTRFDWQNVVILSEYSSSEDRYSFSKTISIPFEDDHFDLNNLRELSQTLVDRHFSTKKN